MLWILLILLAAGFFAALYVSYCKVFRVDKKKLPGPHRLLAGEQYIPFDEQFHSLIDAALALPFEDVYITSRDGLKLHGRLFSHSPDSPVQILFHGYRSNAYRDFCGGLQLARNAGCNVILVDQRSHGSSEGKCLSFGVLERQDCLCWVDFAISRFGRDTKIILSGVSMGAATVLMASACELPANVCGILADCGYSSPRAIIRKVMQESGYCVPVMYPVVRLAGMVFGGFDIEAASASESLKNCRVPVLLIHGEDDRFVPCEMSRENAAACASEVTLLTVPGAGHGLSYMVDNPAYCRAVSAFLEKNL